MYVVLPSPWVFAVWGVVVSAIQGTAALGDFTLRAGLTLGLGMLTACALWWLYFDYVSRLPVRQGFWNSQGFTYLHMPLMLTITGAGAVLLYIIEHSSQPMGVLTLLGSSVLLLGVPVYFGINAWLRLRLNQPAVEEA